MTVAFAALCPDGSDWWLATASRFTKPPKPDLSISSKFLLLKLLNDDLSISSKFFLTKPPKPDLSISSKFFLVNPLNPDLSISSKFFLVNPLKPDLSISSKFFLVNPLKPDLSISSKFFLVNPLKPDLSISSKFFLTNPLNPELSISSKFRFSVPNDIPVIGSKLAISIKQKRCKFWIFIILISSPNLRFLADPIDTPLIVSKLVLFGRLSCLSSWLCSLACLTRGPRLALLHALIRAMPSSRSICCCNFASTMRSNSLLLVIHNHSMVNKVLMK